MLPPESYEYTRYLRSKTTVDDRALNRVVIEALREELQARGAEPLRVLELGAGVGTMVARLSEWRIVENAHFTLVDRDAKSLQAAKELLTGPDSATLPQRVSDGDESLALTFVESDIFSFLRGCRRKYDLVLANAVLDLLQVPALLEALKGVTAPSALLWFTINFDGETIFLPELPLDGAHHGALPPQHGSQGAGRRALWRQQIGAASPSTPEQCRSKDPRSRQL